MFQEHEILLMSLFVALGSSVLGSILVILATKILPKQEPKFVQIRKQEPKFVQIRTNNRD